MKVESMESLHSGSGFNVSEEAWSEAGEVD